MKTTVMLPTNEGRRPSDIIEDSYVTQNVMNDRNNSLSSTGNMNNLSSSSSPSATSLDVNSFMDTSVWPINTTTASTPLTLSPKQQHLQQSQQNIIHPLDSTLMMNDWNTSSTFPAGLKTEDWIISYIDQPMDNYTLSNTNNNIGLQYPTNSGFHSAPSSMANTAISTPTSGVLHPMSTTKQRRTSHTHHRTYNRRSASQPSVASVVSLTAHEPVSKVIDGIEYITFLYSHDRLVKEYTIRTDIDNVNLNDAAMDFRIQNAIYPRANVSRSEYDGNRWDYETTCNQLGWKLCWLNKDQLFGRRGLIQRAVDSYRNRHAEMRSRRVTRQEKVANGTLRKRRSKKSLSQSSTTTP